MLTWLLVRLDSFNRVINWIKTGNDNENRNNADKDYQDARTVKAPCFPCFCVAAHVDSFFPFGPGFCFRFAILATSRSENTRTPNFSRPVIPRSRAIWLTLGAETFNRLATSYRISIVSNLRARKR